MSEGGTGVYLKEKCWRKAKVGKVGEPRGQGEEAKEGKGVLHIT